MSFGDDDLRAMEGAALPSPIHPAVAGCPCRLRAEVERLREKVQQCSHDAACWRWMMDMPAALLCSQLKLWSQSYVPQYVIKATATRSLRAPRVRALPCFGGAE